MPHTPTPWLLIEDAHGAIVHRRLEYAPGKFRNDSLGIFGSAGIDPAEAIANAHLFMAAPRMAATLDLVETYLADGAPHTALDRVRALLEELKKAGVL